MKFVIPFGRLNRPADPTLVLIKGMTGTEQVGHKYIKRTWMNGHWMYTYADEHGGKVAGHETDLDRVVLKLPKEKVQQLKAFREKHGIAGDVFVGGKYAMLAVTQKEAAAIQSKGPSTPAAAAVAPAAPEPAKKPAAKPKKPKKGAVSTEHAIKAEDIKRLGPMELAPAASLNMPKVSSHIIATGQSVSVKLDGKQVSATLKGHNVSGLPIVEHNGQRRVIAPVGGKQWGGVAVQGEKGAQKPSIHGLKPEALVKANDRQKKLIDDIMSAPILKGHAGGEAVGWLRKNGQEVYLVGGIVRDMLAGTKPGSTMTDAQIGDTMKDVDLVSTASPALGRKMLESVMDMKGADLDKATHNMAWGTIKASTATSGMDFASVASEGTHRNRAMNPDIGQEEVHATWDHDLMKDTERRDFSCNSIYYDTVNHVIIDPTGEGIADAQNKVLRLCAKGEGLTMNGKLSVRYFKFRMRGYTPEAETLKQMHKLGEMEMGKIKESRRAVVWGEVCAQKGGTISENFDKLKSRMQEDGCGDLFEKFVAPHEAAIKFVAQSKRDEAKAEEASNA